MSAGEPTACSSDEEPTCRRHSHPLREVASAAGRSWGTGRLNQPPSLPSDDPQTAGIAALQTSIPALQRYALVLLRDRQGVEDLVHDCLVQALTHMRSRKAGDIRPWLFSIMHNLFISQKRRERRRGRNIPIESMVEFGAEGRLNSEATQEDRLRWRDLLRALNELPMELRLVITLVSVEELSYAAVAEVLGIPIGTVMSRLSRGRERLRQMMAGERRPILRSVK
jgi:RNA polymerase sigma-70 factor, ECF subfamily